MKLGHSNTVLPALKKSLLLDHQSLANYFEEMKNEPKKPQILDSYFEEN